MTQNDAHICRSVTNSHMHMRCPRHPQHVRFNVSLLSQESLPARWSHNSAGRPLTRIFDEVNAVGSRGGWGGGGGTAKPRWSICVEQHSTEREDGRNAKIYSLWQHISTELGFFLLLPPPHGSHSTGNLLQKNRSGVFKWQQLSCSILK